MKVIPELYKLVVFLLNCAGSIKYARALFILVLVTGILAGLSNTALIALINTKLTAPDGGSGNLLWGFIGLCILLPVSRFVSQVLLLHITQGAIVQLRTQMCRRILLAPTRLLEGLGSHRLLATLTEDIPTIGAVITALPVFCMHIAIVISCLIYLGWLSQFLLLAVLVIMACGILTYQVPVLKAMKYFRQAREKGDDLFKHLRALTEGTKELKLHRGRRDAFFSGQLVSTILSLQHNNVTGNMIFSAASAWGQILFFILIGLILFILPGVRPTDAHTLMGYTLTILYMITPLEIILNTIPSFSRAHISAQKVESLGLSLGAEPAEIESEGSPVDGRPAWRRLEVLDVTHTYKTENSDDSFTLGPVSVNLFPERIVFLVGGNGSGKTTLAKLLIGLYTPDTGEIRLDGKPVTDENRDEYRQLFSVVFSDFYLFEALLGLPGSDLDERARAYIAQLQLKNKVQVNDGKLSTIDLSQGQRKRLALLTAYLEDRSIYLFDEWAADQDPYFKEIFYYELLPALKARGKTALVISHDDRYYHVADRIVKLDSGKIEYDKLVGEAQTRPITTSSGAKP
jgi:putative ATP-binding cassette transporter